MAYETAADATRQKALKSRIAGLLLTTTLAEMLAIWHHPHVRAQDQLQATLAIVAVSHLAGFIHAMAIGCCLLIAYCLGELLSGRMPAFLFRGAALAYGAGLTTLTTAATVDGWVLERLAASLVHNSAVDLESNARLFSLCMALVVASTNVGMVLTSVGMLIASAGLLRHGRYWQIAGVVGLAVGVALFSAIGAGHLSMDGHGMLVAVGLQGLWFITVSMASLIRDTGQNS